MYKYKYIYIYKDIHIYHDTVAVAILGLRERENHVGNHSGPYSTHMVPNDLPGHHRTWIRLVSCLYSIEDPGGRDPEPVGEQLTKMIW